MRPFSSALFLALLLVGCVQTEVTMLSPTSTDRSPVDTSQVHVYADTTEFACPWEKVALIQAQASRASVAEEKLIQRSKAEAAKINANALVVGDINAAPSPNDKRRYEGRSGELLAAYEERPCN